MAQSYNLKAQLNEIKITDNWESFCEFNYFLDNKFKKVEYLSATYFCVEKVESGNHSRGFRFVYRLDSSLCFVKSYSNLEDNILDGLVQCYNKNDVLTEISSYSNNATYGKFIKYFDNGVLREEGERKGNFILQDTLKTYYGSGSRRRIDYYRDGNLITGNCYAASGADTSYFPYLVNAKFLEGSDALSKYISTSIVYPEEALYMGETGRVYVSFIVEEDGSISNVQVTKGVSAALDKEAKRAIKNMPNWIPGAQDGYPVRTLAQIPIIFSFGGDEPKKKKKRRN